MGKRVIGDWHVGEDHTKGDYLEDRLVGASLAAQGYRELMTTEKLFGTPTAQKSAQDEYDAFIAQAEAWRQNVIASLNGNTSDHY